DNGTIGTEHADLAAVDFLDADAIALARGGVEQRHVRDVDRQGLLDDATGVVGHRVGLDVLLDDVHALDQDVVGVDASQHGAATLLVAAGQDDDFVAFTNVVHRGLLTALRGPATRSS